MSVSASASPLAQHAHRPYRFHDSWQSASGCWEMWMDASQPRVVRPARREG